MGFSFRNTQQSKKSIGKTFALNSEGHAKKSKGWLSEKWTAFLRLQLQKDKEYENIDSSIFRTAFVFMNI